jgi:hypothetical protein
MTTDQEMFLKQKDFQNLWSGSTIRNQYRKNDGSSLIQFDKSNGSLCMFEGIYGRSIPTIILSLHFDNGTLCQETYSEFESGFLYYEWGDQYFTWLKEPNIPKSTFCTVNEPFLSKKNKDILLLETNIRGYHEYHKSEWLFNKYLTEFGIRFTEAETQPNKRTYEEFASSGDWLKVASSSRVTCL